MLVALSIATWFAVVSMDLLFDVPVASCFDAEFENLRRMLHEKVQQALVAYTVSNKRRRITCGWYTQPRNAATWDLFLCDPATVND